MNLIDGVEGFCKSMGLENLDNFDPNSLKSARMHAYNEIRKAFLDLFISRHITVNLLCDLINFFTAIRSMTLLVLKEMHVNPQGVDEAHKICTMFNAASQKCELLCKNIKFQVPEAMNLKIDFNFTCVPKAIIRSMEESGNFGSGTFDALIKAIKTNTNLETDDGSNEAPA